MLISGAGAVAPATGVSGVAAAKDYRGIFFSGADAKSRFTLPADLRHRVKVGNGDENYLHLSLDSDKPYLLGFAEDYFAFAKAQIDARAEMALSNGQEFDRHRAAKKLAAHTETVTFDEGGRFSIPDDIREVMGLGDELVFVGAIDTFEIWSPERFKAESEDATPIQIKRCEAFQEAFAAKSSGRGKRA